MSDIPKARRTLQIALVQDDLILMRRCIHKALHLMHRKRPKFIHKAQYPKLTLDGRKHARRLRAKGMSLNDIALHLRTNMGRVSKAINTKN